MSLLAKDRCERAKGVDFQGEKTGEDGVREKAPEEMREEKQGKEEKQRRKE